MYKSLYGFKAKPFSIVPNPNIIFLNKNYQNALSYMKYGLKEKVGFILLTGEIGAGKTTMIRYMLSAIEDQMDFAVIFNTNFSSDQLFRLILSEFEISSDSTEKEQHLELLYQFLIDRYEQRRHVLLVVDEAQNLSDEALEDIRMLSNLQTNEQILIQIMLVGQPELKKRLTSPDFRQLAQRIAVSYHLPPLTEDQTYLYIAYRIEAVGGQPDLFTPEAVKLIHDNSGGIPRTINLLCDACLVYGYADDLQRIDTDTVELVLADQICILDQNCHANHIEPPPEIDSQGKTDDLRSRMSWVERNVSDLRWRVEDLSREVKNELLSKYQELLISERNKYNQLEKKYDQLFKEHAWVLNQPDRITPNNIKGSNIDPHHQLSTENTSDQMQKLSMLWNKILFKWSSFSAKALKVHENFSIPQISLPVVKRLVDGTNFNKRITQHWLFLFVVILIPVSVISLFLSTKSPVTANVSSTKRLEKMDEAELYPNTTKEEEGVINFSSEKVIYSEPEKTVAANREKQMSLRHIVQSGDTLSSIAREYKTSVAAIINENKLQNNLIYIGQIIKIPFFDDEVSNRNAG